MDLAEVVYITELRTSPAGHWSYRNVAWQMYQAVANQHPSLARYFRVHDVREPVDLLKRVIARPAKRRTKLRAISTAAREGNYRDGFKVYYFLRLGFFAPQQPAMRQTHRYPGNCRSWRLPGSPSCSSKRRDV